MQFLTSQRLDIFRPFMSLPLSQAVVLWDALNRRKDARLRLGFVGLFILGFVLG